MVSDPERCRSDDSSGNHQNYGADDLGRDPAGNPDRNLTRSSEDCGRGNPDDGLQGNLGHNSRDYPGDDGGDFRESESTDMESSSWQHLGAHCLVSYH
jgi:hypothetical protein